MLKAWLLGFGILSSASAVDWLLDKVDFPGLRGAKVLLGLVFTWTLVSCAAGAGLVWFVKH